MSESEAARSLKPVRWFLWLTLLHTIPSPFFLFVVAGTVPAAGLLATGIAGLFNMDFDGPVMTLVIGGQGVAWAMVYFLIAWLLAVMCIRIRAVLLRTALLAAFSGSAFYLSLQPVYLMAGHGGEEWANLTSLLQGFRVTTEIQRGYAIGLGGLLGLLLLLQATGTPRWMSSLPSPARSVGILLFVGAAAAIWIQRVPLVCQPAAEAGQTWAQLCVARAARERAQGGPAPDAEAWYRRAARGGSLDAARELLEITRTDADRREWLPLLAADGDRQAAVDYWRLLRYGGNTTPEELARARAWLVQAAEGGHGGAALALGRDLLAAGKTTAARKRLEQAADLGEGDAMRELAWRYAQGVPGFPVDLARALALYEQLATGIEAGRYATGGHTLSAEGYRAQADALREVLDAARSGDPVAQRKLARRMLDSPHPGDAGRSEARGWLEAAAESGDVEAQYELGRLLVLGRHGFTPEPEKGRGWWERAAAQEHVLTLRHVAEARTSGRHGFDIDFAQARKEFAVLVDAYTRGVGGVEPDPARAAYWQSALRDAERKLSALGPDHVPVAELRRRAAAGQAEAQFQLGVQLQQAYSVEHRNEAVQWWIRAAAGGHAQAQYRLVSHYLRGQGGVRKNPAEAVRLLRAAAASHHARAIYELGLVYEKGRHGVTRDLEQAGRFYAQILAAEAENPHGWVEEPRFYRMVANRLRAVERMQGIAGSG